jgi:polyisoprenoid-binding protein YceI
MSAEQEANNAAVRHFDNATDGRDLELLANTIDATAGGRTGEQIHGRWQLDPRRSSVEFSARHFWGLLPVKGHFDDYHGRLDLSATTAIELTIDAATIQTGNAKRDQHLRTADFFDAENHPRVQFRSDSVELRNDTLRVRGRLSARGRSIPVELEARFHLVNGELEINAATTAPHRELGMTWSPLGMIRPYSKLLVNAHLIPDVEGPDTT